MSRKNLKSLLEILEAAMPEDEANREAITPKNASRYYGKTTVESHIPANLRLIDALRRYLNRGDEIHRAFGLGSDKPGNPGGITIHFEKLVKAERLKRAHPEKVWKQIACETDWPGSKVDPQKAGKNLKAAYHKMDVPTEAAVKAAAEAAVKAAAVEYTKKIC
jgi:hypothetical protein